MKKPILISGIQPTGKLHIGNYLGALKNFVELQDSGKYDCYFFVADLHSLTEDFNPKEKPKQILDVVLSFLAAGIDPKKSTIFIQSQIEGPAELAWIFNVITPFGELGRMIQFKEKAGSQKENINAGLFNYPILMAADILLFKSRFVPVGDDQLQHLEFTRTIARKFNSRFGKVFPEPKQILTEAPRLMSLDDPEKKMSKSRPEGCLFLDDSPKEITIKIKRAMTDSGKEIRYDPKKKPAIANLMKIYEILGAKTFKNIERKFKGKGYGDFKSDLANIVIDHLKPFQEKKSRLQSKPEEIAGIIGRGRERVQGIALKTLAEVKKKTGLIL